MGSYKTAQVYYDSTNADYWAKQAFWPGTALNAVPPAQIQGSQLTVQFSRSVEAGFQEDRAMFRLHMAVDAGPGANMVPLSAAQAASVESAFDARWTGGLAAIVQTRWTLAEYTWRNFGAAYPLDDNGVSKPGPIWRSVPKTTPGTSAGTALPDQLAATVTYRTASRHHWGRSYWGGLSSGAFTGETSGKLANAYVDTLAIQFDSWFNALAALPAVTNVWVWSARHRGLLSITELAVDDVPDIVRRRRAKASTYKHVFP